VLELGREGMEMIRRVLFAVLWGLVFWFAAMIFGEKRWM